MIIDKAQQIIDYCNKHCGTCITTCKYCRGLVCIYRDKTNLGFAKFPCNYKDVKEFRRVLFKDKLDRI